MGAQFLCRLFQLVQALTIIARFATLVCHGLTSRPRVTADEPFHTELLRLFGFAGKSGAELLNGTLNVKYCDAAFARELPTWCLPFPSDVALLIIVDDVDILAAREAVSESLKEQRHWVGGIGDGRKILRLTRQTNRSPFFIQELSQDSRFQDVA